MKFQICNARFRMPDLLKSHFYLTIEFVGAVFNPPNLQEKT